MVKDILITSLFNGHNNDILLDIAQTFLLSSGSRPGPC